MELFGGKSPTQASFNEFGSGYYDLGVKFIPLVDGQIEAIHFWLQPNGVLEDTWKIWETKDSGEIILINKGSFGSFSLHGWQTAQLKHPQKVEARKTYIVSVPAIINYPFAWDFHGLPIYTANCLFPINAGVFSSYRKDVPPSLSFRGSTYYRDFTFERAWTT